MEPTVSMKNSPRNLGEIVVVRDHRKGPSDEQNPQRKRKRKKKRKPNEVKIKRSDFISSWMDIHNNIIKIFRRVNDLRGRICVLGVEERSEEKLLFLRSSNRLLGLLGQEVGVDVGENTTRSNGDTREEACSTRHRS